MRKIGKSDIEIKQRLIDRIINGDTRFIYDKFSKIINIVDSDFFDLK